MRQRLFEFVRFCVVGFLGYLVDAALLEGFAYAGMSDAMARLISMVIALQVTYTLHSLWTYRGHGGFSRKAWLHFMAVNLIGASINYAVYLVALHRLHLPADWMNRQAALVCGMAVAMWFNYLANRWFVFKAVKP